MQQLNVTLGRVVAEKTPSIGFRSIGHWMRAAICALVFICQGMGITTEVLLAQDTGKKPGQAGVGDDIDFGKLPPNFNPRGEKPKIMTIEKPLLTVAQEKKLSTKLRNDGYSRIRRNGTLTNATSGLIKDGIRYRVHRLSMPVHRLELHKRRTELFREINDAGSLQSSATEKANFRRFFLKEVTDRAVELLDGNLYVRIQAALVISKLNVVNRNAAKAIEEVAYTPASKSLIAILKDKAQHSAVKIIAAKGIYHIARKGEANSTLRFEIASTLLEELKAPDSHPWYRVRLIEALSAVELTVDRNDRPFIVRTMIDFMGDKSQSWIVRSSAARGLGRARLDDRVSVNLLTHQLVSFGDEMNKAYKSNRNQFYWKKCFFNLYLAFVPLNGSEKKDLDAGLLTKYEANQNVQSAYAVVLPMGVKVWDFFQFKNKWPNLNVDDEVKKWLSQNRPNSFSIWKDLPPITDTQNRPATGNSAG